MVKNIYIASSLFFLVAILLTPSEPLILPAIPHEGVTQFQRTGKATPRAPRLEDATLNSGIYFAHRQGNEKLTGLNEVLGPGACAFDYDNDGWVDLFLVNGSGESRYYGKEHWWQQSPGHQLFKNLGNARFKNVSREANISTNTWGMGCATADLDNDGDQDLIITNSGPNLLFRNNGDGSFSDVTAQSGLKGEQWSTSVAIGDFDHDGLPDLYVTNYIRFVKGAFTYEKQNSFSGTGQQLTFDSALYDAVENQLYHNEGNLIFRDVSNEYGVANAGGRSLDAAWLDVNADRYPDLYIVNDKGIGSNTLYINHDGKGFLEASIDAKAGSAGGHTSVSGGDIDNDGDLDILLSSRITRTHNLLINRSEQSAGGKASRPLFGDEARPRGIGGELSSSNTGWGSGIHDLNNDGWQDIFIANGLLLPEKESPRVTVGQGNELWLNNRGKLTLMHGSQDMHFAARESSRGVAFADFNNDGALDLYIASNNGMGQLLLNHSTGNWLTLRLQGGEENRDALGSRITITTTDGRQQRLVGNRHGFLSSNEERLHFGLGEHSVIESLEIQWYDDSRTIFEQLQANRHLLLVKGARQLQPQTLTANSAHTDAKLHLGLGRERSDNRADYVGWLPHFLKPEQALPELQAAISDESEAVRLEALRALRKLDHPQALSLTIDAIADSSPTVSLAALEAACTYEDEYATRWLFREFYSPRPEHRKAVADCFEFYFREEEAVVHRKWLAIPHLIALLQDSEDEVVMAAINALAEAENYRAVSPLIRIVTARERVEAILVNAIRAIGLIRERNALDFITTEVKSSNNSPAVHAQLMIAFKRLEPSLDYRQIEELALPYLNSATESDIQARRAAYTLLCLLEAIQSDAVFSTRLVYESLNKLYEKQKEIFAADETLLIRYLRTLAASPEQAEVLAQHLGHPSGSIRQEILLGLIDNAPGNSSKYVKRAFADPDARIRQAVTRLLNEKKITISDEFYLTLLSDRKTQPLALQLEHVNPNREALRQLLTIAADSSIEELSRVAALRAMRRSKLPPVTLPTAVIGSDSGSLQAEALYYINANHSPYPDQDMISRLYRAALQGNDPSVARAALHVLAKSHQQWARESVAEALRRDQSLKLRKLALATTAQFCELPHNAQMLYEVAREPADPLQRVALRLLAEAQQLHQYPELASHTGHNNDHFIIVKSLIDAGSTEAFFQLREAAQ